MTLTGRHLLSSPVIEVTRSWGLSRGHGGHIEAWLVLGRFGQRLGPSGAVNHPPMSRDHQRSRAEKIPF